MAMPKALQDVRKKQKEAFGNARVLVERQMNVLKKGQPAGEPIKLNTEAFRKSFAHAIAAQVLITQQCTVPTIAEAEKLELL